MKEKGRRKVENKQADRASKKGNIYIRRKYWTLLPSYIPPQTKYKETGVLTRLAACADRGSYTVNWEGGVGGYLDFPPYILSQCDQDTV